MEQPFSSEGIAAILDGLASVPDSSHQKQVMNQIVNVIREKSDVYFVSLYLIDRAKKRVVFQAGTGEFEELMLSAGHFYHLTLPLTEH